MNHQRHHQMLRALFLSAKSFVDIHDLVLEAKLDESKLNCFYNKFAILEILKYEPDMKIKLWKNGIYYVSNYKISPEEYLQDVIKAELDLDN